MQSCLLPLLRSNNNREGSFRILQSQGLSWLFLLHEPSREILFTILKNNKPIIALKNKRKSNNLFICNFYVEFAEDLKFFRNWGNNLFLYQLTVWISCKLRDTLFLQDRFMINSYPMTICKQRCLIFINSGQTDGSIVKYLIYYVGSQPSYA